MRKIGAWLIAIAVCAGVAKALFFVFYLLSGQSAPGTNVSREPTQVDAGRPAVERTREAPEAQPADEEPEPREVERTPDLAEEQFQADPDTLTQENQHPPPATRGPPASSILKCRDASGAITLTQGYCPPGTSPVATPPAN